MTKKKTGRNSKLTPARQRKICDAISHGNTYAAAAKHAGVTESTFYRWKSKGDEGDDEYSEFSEALRRAEAVAEFRCIQVIHEAAARGDWRAAAWWLERRCPADYGNHQTVEHTGAINIQYLDAGGLDEDGEIFDIEPLRRVG